MEFDFTTIVLAIIVFSLMLMVIGLRFEVRSLREEMNRLAESPRYPRPSPMIASSDGEQGPRPSSAGDDHLRSLVAKGRKIEAIKEAREMYNFSLKEAKNYVESL
ncbi:hypothetical protein [Saccharibacillus sacchari]|uniref:Uncharacterized protein n=1 Tax=Saccharibacillus sacchari TaxID=456493 RepID=A0ACC6P8H2_9BACL